MKLISANKLNRLWNNGVVAKMVAKTKILKTLEEIEANTNEENVAGATALKEVNNNLTSRPDWIYDENGKIIGYKTPGGADTVFPFSSGKCGSFSGSAYIDLGFKPKHIIIYYYSSYDTTGKQILHYDVENSKIYQMNAFEVDTTVVLQSFFKLTTDGFYFYTDGYMPYTIYYVAI